jgi:hypothetical protein
VDPVLGSLVYQLLGGITLAYNLCLGCTISHWKGIDEEFHFTGSIMPTTIIEMLDHEKVSFRPLKWPWKFRTQKTAKNSKFPKNYFEPVIIGGFPPISTWINPPSLGRNGIHCVEFPGERGKHLLNLNLGELLTLLDKLGCLACARFLRT